MKISLGSLSGHEFYQFEEILWGIVRNRRAIVMTDGLLVRQPFVIIYLWWITWFMRGSPWKSVMKPTVRTLKDDDGMHDERNFKWERREVDTTGLDLYQTICSWCSGECWSNNKCVSIPYNSCSTSADIAAFNLSIYQCIQMHSTSDHICSEEKTGIFSWFAVMAVSPQQPNTR